MSARAASESGTPVLRVRFDYLFVSAGVQCSVRDGYIHPDYPRGRSSGLPASGAPQDPYATATPSTGPAESCQTITST